VSLFLFNHYLPTDLAVTKSATLGEVCNFAVRVCHFFWILDSGLRNIFIKEKLALSWWRLLGLSLSTELAVMKV
jgi:hypothetical protein